MLFENPLLAYIDPGTGSMLFTVIISIAGAGIYALRMLLIKIKFRMSGGKAEAGKDKLPFVIFAESKRYWNIFYPICRELDRRKKDVLYITSSPDDPVFECGLPHIKAECIESQNRLFARLNMIKAHILISSTPGLDVYQWKRSREVDYYIHLPHACTEIIMYKMFGIDYYDALLLSGEYQKNDVRDLETIRDLPQKDIRLVGVPYMDDMMERFKGAGSIEKDPDSRTVLLAPTWGENGLLTVYGERIIDELIATGHHLVIRPHPQSFTSEKELMDRLMEKYPESENLEWNRDSDNFDVLRRSDVLISDYSGVIFDFSLVYDKPVIYTNPDFTLDPYDAWWLDHPLWTFDALPKLGAELTDDAIGDIGQLIDNVLTNDIYAKGRASVREETWMHQGMGAENTADYLISKLEELTLGGAA